jgi:hypothetical protein
MSEQAFAPSSTVIPPARVSSGNAVYSQLPHMWPLLVFATLTLVAEALIFGVALTTAGRGPSDEQALTLGFSVLLIPLVRILGWCYWQWCIYRVHKVVAEFTGGEYSISPRKAFGMGLIPFFCWVWSFTWTQKLNDFLKQRSSDTATTTKRWPAILLLCASVVGFFEPTTRLILLFCVGSHFRRRLRATLPAAEPLPFRRRHQMSLAMSAGVGAAFSFVIFQSLRDFWNEPMVEMKNEIAAIVLVSIAVLIFLEPLFDHIRQWLGLGHHQESVKARTWRLRLGIFLILAAISTLHGLLHTAIHEAVNQAGLGESLAALLGMFLVTAAITYVWIGASNRHPPHAARSGVLSGALVGIMVAVAVNAFLTSASQAMTLAPAEVSTHVQPGAVTPAPVPQPTGQKESNNVASSGLGAPAPGSTSKDVLPHDQSRRDQTAADSNAEEDIKDSSKHDKITVQQSKEPGHKPLEIMSAMGSASRSARLDEPGSIALMAIPWALLGLAGGLTLDRGWGRNRTLAVASSLVGCAIIYSAIVWILEPPLGHKMLLHVSAVLGWALALVVASASWVLVLSGPHREKPKAFAAAGGGRS